MITLTVYFVDFWILDLFNFSTLHWDSSFHSPDSGGTISGLHVYMLEGKSYFNTRESKGRTSWVSSDFSDAFSSLFPSFDEILLKVELFLENSRGTAMG